MALEMRTKCERCERVLSLHDDAYICSYECTFCDNCAGEMKHVCPNCGGELVRRPRREAPSPERKRQSGSDRRIPLRKLKGNFIGLAPVFLPLPRDCGAAGDFAREDGK